MNEDEFTKGKADSAQTKPGLITDEIPVPNLITISVLMQYLLTVSEQKALEDGLALTADSLNEKAPGNVLLFVQRAYAEQKIDNLIQALRTHHPELPIDDMMCTPGLVALEPVRPFDGPPISKLLQDVLPKPTQFDEFLKIHFPDFTEKLGEDVAVVTKSRQLFFYCDRRNSLPQLLSILQSEYPDRYEDLAPYTRPERKDEKKKREGLEIVNSQKEAFLVLDREMARREQQLPAPIVLVKSAQLPAKKMRTIQNIVWMDDDLVLNLYKENVRLLAHDSTELEAVDLFVGKKHLLKLPQKNQLLAIGSTGGTNAYLEVWDLAIRSKKVIIQDKQMYDLTAVTHTPDGKTAVTGHRDNTIRFWNLETGQKADEWHAHPREVRGLAVSPDGDYLISLGWDSTLRVWDFYKGSQITNIDVPGQIQYTELSPDGSMLAVNYNTGSDIYIYKLEYKTSGLFSKKRKAEVTMIKKLDDMKRALSSFSFSADGRFFAAMAGGRITTIWRTSDWSVYATLLHTSGHALAFHPKRPLLAMTHQNKIGVRILQIE